MKLTGFLAISLSVLQQFVVQAELMISYDDIVIASLNPEYYNIEKTFAYIVNDNEADKLNMNFTIIKKAPMDLEAKFRLLALSMGQYKVSTGVSLKFPFCDTFDEPILLGPIFTSVGFIPEDCPPSPGSYSTEGFRLPIEGFPDDFPENKYLAEIEVASKDKLVLKLNIFLDITSI